MEFENELRGALRREEPSADFAALVQARLPRRKNRFLPWALAAGIAVGVAIPSAVYERRQEQRERGMEAARELITALNITRTKLKQTVDKIQHRPGRI